MGGAVVGGAVVGGAVVGGAVVGGAVVGGAVVGGAVVGGAVVGGAVVGWVVVACDDALADAVGCLLADGDAEADALLVAAVTEEIFAAGDGTGSACVLAS